MLLNTQQHDEPTLRDVMEKLASMQRSLDGINTAFVRDDLDRPDYDGHRKDHLERIKLHAHVDAFKLTITKRIAIYLAAGAGALLLTGGTEWIRQLVIVAAAK